MSANTSRVIWKGGKSQKSPAKPGLTPKAKYTLVQKMDCICATNKRTHFYHILNCCHLLAHPSLKQDHVQLLQPKLHKTLTSLTAIDKSSFSQEAVKTISSYVGGGCMEKLGQVKAWNISEAFKVSPSS